MPPLHPSPATDTVIVSPYSAESIERKLQNKLTLQEKLGWPPEKKRAMVCIPTALSEEHGGTLLKTLLPGLLELPIELLILGKGTKEFGTLLSHIAQEESHRIAIISNDTAALRKMYAAADIALFPCDPAGSPELSFCLRYGVIPIAPLADTLENYNPNQERGCAFLYDPPSAWRCFAALVRALETYRFPFDWRNIQKEAMRRAH